VRVWRPLEKKSTANQCKEHNVEKYIQWVTMLWLHGSIFIRLAVVASQICEIPRNSAKIRTHSSSRSSKVIDLCANWKRICNFLLVFPTVFEILAFKARKWLALSTPPLFDAHAWGEPIKISGWSLPCRNPEGWGYRGEYFIILTKTVLIHQCDRRTDGQTDGR